jgi:hypothetical protein
MAKTKISEFSTTAADNTDITNINIAEGCSPANLNNAVRSLMALLKDQQTGSSGDPFTVAGTLVSSGTVDITGAFRLDGTAGASGQVLVSSGGSTTPTWTNGFVTGMIMMWSGTIATIPTGWYLCNGSNSTPDLRNRFVIGAFSDTTGVAYTTVTGSNTQTGGTKDAIVVSHTHTATDSGHTHSINNPRQPQGGEVGGITNTPPAAANDSGTVATTQTGTANITVSTTGSSGTDQNLPPYYALAFIMKA